jgi:hypothetical protein
MPVGIFSAATVAPGFQTGFLWKQLDVLDRAFEPNALDATFRLTILLAALVGFFLWQLSDGSLLAGPLATTLRPSKRSPSSDPLLVLELWAKEFKEPRQGREDEETLRSLMRG